MAGTIDPPVLVDRLFRGEAGRLAREFARDPAGGAALDEHGCR
jgi:hypothetical protein